MSHKPPSKEAARKGGLTRMKRLREQAEAQGLTLGDYQRRIRARVSSQSCAANGRKGAQATIAKHGLEFFHKKAVAYRLDHPSAPERKVIDVLATLGACFEREHAPIAGRFYTVDFWLSSRNAVIEVEGGVHDDPLFDPDGRRAAYTAEKYKLLERLGFRVLVLKCSDLRDGLQERVRAFLESE